MVRGLLLDFYGTVVEDDDAIIEAVGARVAAGASRPVGADRVVEEWTREFAAVADGTPFRTLRECATRSLATVMERVGCPGDAARLCAPQFAYWRAPPVRPGTLEFLAGLDLPVCVVSDVDRDDLDAAIAHHGLSFTAVVTSQEVGAYKPAAAMFARGLAALSLDAADVLHVGDSARNDVGGAHAAGIRAVWVNRRGRPPLAKASYEIADLGGLAAVLRAF
ncbi:HAD family hydrolase [Phytohabitans houttuyneae]|uniref:Dehalogenase n=1 Tax=Phytohabitans houttuyneae TaxID=1076126 RepID=A0A6V8KLN3_9ACTN|nr:HAD family hydrolase [Phytohabitans houttuyneae]GFJ82846.1 dehalogenase [Phytohabitans houttuyneae]